LLPNLDFALSEAIDNVAKINPDAAVLQLSARSGQGMTEYYDWLRNEFAAAQQSAFA
jgi:hydrogenase nickel incorporation protein HypB